MKIAKKKKPKNKNKKRQMITKLLKLRFLSKNSNEERCAYENVFVDIGG